MAKVDLSKYGITGTTEVVYNPSYEQLFEEETKPGLEGGETVCADEVDLACRAALIGGQQAVEPGHPFKSRAACSA